MYLDWAIPSRQRVFELYLMNLRWAKFKRKLIADIHKQYPVKNNTTIDDVPMMCRLQQQFF